MIVIFEFDKRRIPGPLFGRFKSVLGGKKFRRYWCRYIAITFWPGDL